MLNADMNRERSLLLNSILYFLGSLGKGIASVIVVFMGSFYIDPSDMGIYDLVVSTIALLQPIIIFQINDGIYRWLLDDSIDSFDTIRCGYRIVIRNLIIANAVMLIVLPFLPIQHKILVDLLVNVNCLYPVFQQITRGLKQHRIFAVSGIINAAIMLSAAFVLLKCSNMGIGSIYLAQIIANGASILYLIIAEHLPLRIDNVNKSIEERIRKPMQRYSVLLIPNSVNQWIMKALDKYCILAVLTTSANGIYTVAHRFPEVIIMLNNMFYSAWVEQSIVEYDSGDRDRYFSKIYNGYTKFLTSAILVILPITKYLIRILIGQEYQSAYKYVPFLYIAVIFSGMSSFIGTGYLGTRKTEGIMWTSLVGALINTIINILLMPRFGLQIAGISSVCAYFAMWIFRIVQTRKFFTLSVEWGSFLLLILTAFLFAVMVQMDNFLCDIIMEAVAVLIFFFGNKKVIFGLIKMLRNMVSRK